MRREKYIYVMILVLMFISINTFNINANEEDEKTNFNMYELETGRAADRIISQIISDGMSDLEKEIAIHDYIVSSTAYDLENYQNGTVPYVSHKAYGVLVKKVAVCSGYAKAFELLCHKAGLECFYVNSSSMDHAWNMIQLDGKWYHVDTTWDDRTPDSPGKVRYDYFNLSDEEMRATNHKWIEADANGIQALDAYNAFNPMADTRRVYNNGFLWFDNKARSLNHVSLDWQTSTTLTTLAQPSYNYAYVIDAFEGNLYYLQYIYNFTDKQYAKHIYKMNLSTYETTLLIDNLDNYRASIQNGILYYNKENMEQTYNLNREGTLKSLVVNGQSLPITNVDIMHFEYELLYQASQIDVLATAHDENSQIEIIQPSSYPGVIEIRITNSNNEQKVYTVTVTVKNTGDFLWYEIQNTEECFEIYYPTLYIKSEEGYVTYDRLEVDMEKTADSLHIYIKKDFNLSDQAYIAFECWDYTTKVNGGFFIEELDTNRKKTFNFSDLYTEITLPAVDTPSRYYFTADYYDENDNLIFTYPHQNPNEVTMRIPKGYCKFSFDAFNSTDTYLYTTDLVHLTDDSYSTLFPTNREKIIVHNLPDEMKAKGIKSAYTYMHHQNNNTTDSRRVIHLITPTDCQLVTELQFEDDSQLIVTHDNVYDSTDVTLSIDFKPTLTADNIGSAYDDDNPLSSELFSMKDALGFQYYYTASLAIHEPIKGVIEYWKSGELYAKNYLHYNKEGHVALPKSSGDYELVYRIENYPIAIDSTIHQIRIDTENDHAPAVIKQVTFDQNVFKEFNPNRTLYYIPKEWGVSMIYYTLSDGSQHQAYMGREFSFIELSQEDDVLNTYYFILVDSITANDYNDDGSVDTLDYLILSEKYGHHYRDCNFDYQKDLSPDGVIDIRDLLLLSSQY